MHNKHLVSVNPVQYIQKYSLLRRQTRSFRLSNQVPACGILPLVTPVVD